MKIKKNLKWLSIFPALAIGSSIAIVNTNQINSISKENSSLNDVSTSAVDTQANNLSFDLNKTNQDSQYKGTNFYVQNDMPSISNANGPILLSDSGRTIAAYDWYGNPSWFVNLNSSKDANDFQASYYKYSNALSSNIKWNEVGTKVVDYAYMPKNDFLYVLTDTSYLFLIQSTTGTINSVKKIEGNINKISIIDFNNTLYGWSTANAGGPVYKIDAQKLTTEKAMDTNASGITGKYIFDILPLDVGYNVVLVNNEQIPNSNYALRTLKAILVQDDGNKFNSSTDNSIINGILEKDIILPVSKSAKEIYSTTLKRNDSNILIVGNSIFSITLNKSAMENTQFIELNKKEQTGSTAIQEISIQNINSAFIDENNLIYLKDESANIYQITLNNKINTSITLQINNGSVFYGENVAKNARIYPVLKNSSSQIAINGTGYIASPSNFAATGFLNGSALKNNFTSNAYRPSFNLKNTFKNNISSSITPEGFFTTQNATGYDNQNNNTMIYGDDISGETFIKTRLSVSSWYDNSFNATTSSYVIGKWNAKKINEATTWVSQSEFNSIDGGIFRKRDPNQISDQDVTKYAEQIIKLPSVVASAENKKVDIIVTDRNAKVGNITLKAVVKYQNSDGKWVSYMLKDETKQYTVKPEARDYNFKFYGGSENASVTNEMVDITSLSSNLDSFKKTLPSLIKPTSDNLQAFIEVEDKYPTDDRRVITVTNANDENGTLSLKVHYNNLDPTTQSVFEITYTGLPTTSQMNVNFKGEELTKEEEPIYDGNPVFDENKSIRKITTIQGYTQYGSKLATEVTENELNLVYESKLSDMGFNPKLTIIKEDSGNISSQDAEYGSITVQLDYTDSESQMLGIKLPKTYWDKFGLTEGKTTQRYIGFLPIGETYGVELKAYNSPEVQNVVQNNNVNADINPADLISTLDVRGYNDEGKEADIRIQNFTWNGENLTFSVHAQSTIYNTVTTDKTFTISWSPKFAAIRQRNLIISSTTSVVGVAIVSAGIAMYILRRNKIRRMMK